MRGWGREQGQSAAEFVVKALELWSLIVTGVAACPHIAYGLRNGQSRGGPGGGEQSAAECVVKVLQLPSKIVVTA